jgi:signal transduction histidine kinase
MNSLIEQLLVLYDGFPTPHETIRRAAKFLRDVAACEAVSILVHRADQKALVFAVINGGSNGLLDVAIPSGEGVVWWAFNNGYAVVPDCANDARFSRAIDDGTGFTTRNVIALPFGYQGHRIGVIELINLPARELASPKLEALLKVVAGHVGVAYAASDLHLRLAEKSRRLFEANSTLEEMVLERTKALENVLSELRTQNDFLQNFQAQLLQTEKMAALGQLAAGVAHEINNPAGFIASNLSTARRYWANVSAYIGHLQNINPGTAAEYRARYDIDHIEDDMQRLIDESLEGTSRVTGIVRNLKEFAHPGKGEPEPTNIKALIERTLSIALSPYKHRIGVKFDFRAPAEVTCDPQEMGQVILNLVVNAAQAIAGQGTITIATALTDAGYAIEISDTGPGIPEENLTRIFEPFFSTKPVGEGTGLGLSLSFRMVKKAGGQLSVHSKVGEGSTFQILLPALGGA